MMTEDPQTLLTRALDGDNEAGETLTALAETGSIEGQRALLAGLFLMMEQADITCDDYFDRAIPWARRAVTSGDPADIRRLAVLLDLKARMIRDRGGAALAFVPIEAESYRLLDDLCDRGDQEAFELLSFAEPTATILALQIAGHMRRGERAAANRQPAAPPVLILPDIAPTSRWERARWWLQDRWWDAQDMAGGAVWRVKCWWWALSDRFHEMRGR